MNTILLRHRRDFLSNWIALNPVIPDGQLVIAVDDATGNNLFYFGDGLTAFNDLTAAGIAGPQGETGPAGPAGPQGPAGADGADGADAIGIPDAPVDGSPYVRQDGQWMLAPAGGGGGGGGQGLQLKVGRWLLGANAGGFNTTAATIPFAVADGNYDDLGIVPNNGVITIPSDMHGKYISLSASVWTDMATSNYAHLYICHNGAGDENIAYAHEGSADRSWWNCTVTTGMIEAVAGDTFQVMTRASDGSYSVLNNSLKTHLTMAVYEPVAAPKAFHAFRAYRNGDFTVPGGSVVHVPMNSTQQESATNFFDPAAGKFIVPPELDQRWMTFTAGLRSNTGSWNMTGYMRRITIDPAWSYDLCVSAVGSNNTGGLTLSSGPVRVNAGDTIEVRAFSPATETIVGDHRSFFAGCTVDNN